jgi:hypothetical protein
MNNPNEQVVSNPQSSGEATDIVTPSRQSTSNRIYVPLLIGVIALLLVVIGLLIAANMKATSGSPEVKPTPTTQPVTVYSPIPTVAVTTAPTTKVTGTTTATSVPSITPTAEVAWKNFSFTVRNSDFQPFTVTGSFPANSSLKNEDPEFTISNSNYSLRFATTPEGEIVHYNSYKVLPRHPQFGEIYRVRINEASNSADYVIGPITKAGECAYIESMIGAPCGSNIIVVDGKAAFTINCVATLSNRDNICDKVVNSMRLK